MRPLEEDREASLVQRTTVSHCARHQRLSVARGEELKLPRTELTDVFVISPLAVPRASGHPIARI